MVERAAFPTALRLPPAPKRELGGPCNLLGTERTSFRTRTLPMMPSICASFWLSSSLSTASLYWPLLLGVAGRKPPALLPLSTPRCVPFPFGEAPPG